MAAYEGRLKEIAFTEETTRGTAESTSSGDWRAHEGFDYGPVVDKVVDEGAVGEIGVRRDSEVLREYSQGSVPMILHGDFLTDLNVMLMGDDGTAGDWDLVQTNSHQSYTVSVIDPVKGDIAYPNAMLNSLSVEVAEDNYVMATLDLLGGKEESAALTSSYTAPSSDGKFVVTDLTLKVEDAYGDLAAASGVAFKSLNINFEKNCEFDWDNSGSAPADIHNQDFAASGDLTFKYQDTTYRSLGLGSGKKAIEISMTDGSFTWTIQLPSVDFSEWNDSEDNSAYMTETVTFNADGEDTSNGTIKTSVTTP
jgi:hypothetical protein